MSEDKIIARKLATTDARRALGDLRAHSGPVELALTRDGELPPQMPDGDGAGLFLSVVIGSRAELTKRAARTAARQWRNVSVRYPHAVFYLQLLGYDDDLREIWQFPEAARYVRWWARYAGLEDEDTAQRWFGPSSPTGQAGLEGATLAFLSACGVFGKSAEQRVLRGHTPTIEQ